MAAAAQKITYTATPDQIEAMHSSFDEALERFESTFGTAYPMGIDGESVNGSSLFDVVSPSDTSVVLARMQTGSVANVDSAVAAARAGYPNWSARPWQERVAIIQSAAEMIRERKFDLAAIMIHECGKSRTEAIGEVEEGADLLDYYAKQMVLADGFRLPMESLDPRERNVSVLRPFGVWAVLAPFNFPHALAAGPIGGALVTGNTVVFKPASATALSGYALYQALIDGGVPADALHFITGGGREVGEPLVKHPNVDGAVFTGSREVGMDLYNNFGIEYPKPILTEMGGKNPTIVTRNADLDKAVEGVARSAFGFSGQKCSACSRVYVERPVYDEFMDRLVSRTRELVVGNPADRAVFVGPVIDAAAVARFEEAVKQASGGTVRVGGGRPSDPALANGTFVEPTIVDGLPLDHELFRRELFLPFLTVGAVDSLEEALTAANDTEYGLTAGIFTEDEGEIDRFFDTIEAGVVYANRKGGATTGAWPECQPFCGWKGSGSSGKGALGPYYVMQFLREQSRTVVIDAPAGDPAAIQKSGE
ncbi:MAG: aldehyde dehydrogenase family protein [Chloroflexia bacterium]|nr:aldehyde dehydrogenase family protein [Chloroflexia bacterium]